MADYPPLSERLSSLVINLVIAYALFVFVTSSWTLSGNLESVWFVSACSYWLLCLLSAPWFIQPRDSLVTGVGAMLVLTTMNFTGLPTHYEALNVIRWIAVVFALIAVCFSVAGLLAAEKHRSDPSTKFLFRIAAVVGRGEVQFTGPVLLSILGGYQENYPTILILTAFWMVAATVQPVEKFLAIRRKYKSESNWSDKSKFAGTLIRVDHPKIVRVRLSSMRSWPEQSLFTVKMPDGNEHFVISLYSQVQGSEVVGTGISISERQEPLGLAEGEVVSTHSAEQTAAFIEEMSGSVGAELVGFVVENSTISTITFEVATRAEIAEGDVVFTRIAGRDILYQIVGAQTSEENFDSNPRGTHLVSASQLGEYFQNDGFKKYNWLPEMNAPIFSANSKCFEPAIMTEREFKIGDLPSSNVQVVARADELIQYHTAILGVTGTGKTELALDILGEISGRGAKIFCVDFTGEYRHRLKSLAPIFPAVDPIKATDLEQKLFDVETGPYNAGAEKKILKAFLEGIKADVSKQINDFLESDEQKLAILELSEITNTKASLRLTEVYLSCIMEWARKNRKARQILIVLEEAHTIIPEVHGSGFDFDTQYVVSRIGQIALQGRKYGVGLMVITQRTALVSKTILSQCNTFLTHALIDQTSLNFLESVYSSQHVRLIPNLGRFQFLAFGKGIKAERPIILRKPFDHSKAEASAALDKSLSDDGRGLDGPQITTFE